MNYAVIFRYSFDDDATVYLFAAEEEAKEFLRTNFESERDIDLQYGDCRTEAEIAYDGRSARIVNHYDDHDELTEIFIGNVYR